MEKLNWYNNGQVPHFNKNVTLNNLNDEGFFLVANKYGKVTYVCHGNIGKLYNDFKKKKFQYQNKKIESYTYAIFNKRDEKILRNLQKSFFHNPEYIKASQIADVPRFGIFSKIYKEFHTEMGKEKAMLELFNEFVQISELNGFLNNLEIKLIKQKQSDNFLIFFKTMFYFDIEFKIKEKFKNVSQYKIFDDKFEVIQTYGLIKDKEPAIL